MPILCGHGREALSGSAILYFLSRTPPCGSSPHGAAVDNEVTSGWPDLRNDNTEQVFFSTEDKDKPEHSHHGIIRRFYCFV